jgi:diacylglycerol kinase
MSIIQKTAKSFRYALQGITLLFATQSNARIHLFAALAVVSMGLYLGLERMEWVAIVICTVLVISLEAVNTAIESLTDLVSPDQHPLAGQAKDLAAGAVLIAALGAALVGCIIFLPKIC